MKKGLSTLLAIGILGHSFPIMSVSPVSAASTWNLSIKSNRSSPTMETTSQGTVQVEPIGVYTGFQTVLVGDQTSTVDNVKIRIKVPKKYVRAQAPAIPGQGQEATISFSQFQTATSSTREDTPTDYVFTSTFKSISGNQYLSTPTSFRFNHVDVKDGDIFPVTAELVDSNNTVITSAQYLFKITGQEQQTLLAIPSYTFEGGLTASDYTKYTSNSVTPLKDLIYSTDTGMKSITDPTIQSDPSTSTYIVKYPIYSGDPATIKSYTPINGKPAIMFPVGGASYALDTSGNFDPTHSSYIQDSTKTLNITLPTGARFVTSSGSTIPTATQTTTIPYYSSYDDKMESAYAYAAIDTVNFNQNYTINTDVKTASGTVESRTINVRFVPELVSFFTGTNPSEVHYNPVGKFQYDRQANLGLGVDLPSGVNGTVTVQDISMGFAKKSPFNNTTLMGFKVDSKSTKTIADSAGDIEVYGVVNGVETKLGVLNSTTPFTILDAVRSTYTEYKFKFNNVKLVQDQGIYIQPIFDFSKDQTLPTTNTDSTMDVFKGHYVYDQKTTNNGLETLDTKYPVTFIPDMFTLEAAVIDNNYALGQDWTLQYELDQNLRGRTVISYDSKKEFGLENQVRVTLPNNDTQLTQQLVVLPVGVEPVIKNTPDYSATIVRNIGGTGKNGILYTYPKQLVGTEVQKALFTSTNNESFKVPYRTANQDDQISRYFVINRTGPDKDLSLSDYFKQYGILVDNKYFSIVPDIFDINNNGNTTEEVVKLDYAMRFVGVQEVIIGKLVGKNISESNSWGSTLNKVGVGEQFYYKIGIRNNTAQTQNTLSIIDLLPYTGDKRIVSGTPRGSQFNVSLTKAIEDIPENAPALSRFDILYSTDTTTNSGWVAKSSITDWSTVKKIKVVLKSGQTLAPNDESIIYIPATPLTGSVPQNIAVNSVATSFDGEKTFGDGNEATIKTADYKVSGSVVYTYPNNLNNVYGGVNSSVSLNPGHNVDLYDETGTNLIKNSTSTTSKDFEFTGLENKKYILKFHNNVPGASFVLKDSTNYVEGTKSDVESVLPDQTLATSTVVDFTKQDPTDLYDTTSYYRVRNAILTQPETGTVIVNVIDKDTKQPVTNTQVCLNISGSTLNNCQTTGSGGTVTWPNQPYGKYEFTIPSIDPNYTAPTGPVAITPNLDSTNPTITGVYEVPKKPTSVTVTIVENGGPVAGKEFCITPATGIIPNCKTSDTDGKITWPVPGPGDYTVTEKTPTTGYVPTPDKTVTVTTTDRDPSTTIDLNKQPSSITIKKIYNNTTPVSGVEYCIASPSNISPSCKTTDSSGTVQWTNLPWNTYSFFEKTPSPDYVADPTPFTITTDQTNLNITKVIPAVKVGGPITTPSTVTVVVTENGNPVAGKEFCITPATGITPNCQTSGTDGKITWPVPGPGDYTVTEKTPDQGYVPTTPVIVTVTDTDKNPTKEIPINKQPSSVTIEKVYGNTPLPNVTYCLTGSGITIPDCKTTGTDGKVTWPSLPWGPYVVVEKIPPVGYVPQPNPITITTSSTDLNPIKKIDTEKPSTSITITKVDGNTPLPNVTYCLTGTGITTPDCKTTGPDGKVVWTNPPYGDFTVTEKTPPTGYTADPTPIPVKVTETTPNVEKTIGSNKDKGSITLVKLDKNTLQPIEGVTYKLSTTGAISTGTVINTGSVVTNSSGTIVWPSLPQGTYTLTEISTATGYLVNPNPIVVNIVNTDLNQKVISYAERDSYNLIVYVRGSNGTPLEKVPVSVTQSGSVVFSGTTGTGGVLTFPNIKKGTYTIDQLTSVPGFTKPSTITITDKDFIYKDVTVTLINPFITNSSNNGGGGAIIPPTSTTPGAIIPVRTEWNVLVTVVDEKGNKVNDVTLGLVDKNNVSIDKKPQNGDILYPGVKSGDYTIKQVENNKYQPIGDITISQSRFTQDIDTVKETVVVKLKDDEPLGNIRPDIDPTPNDQVPTTNIDNSKPTDDTTVVDNSTNQPTPNKVTIDTTTKTGTQTSILVILLVLFGLSIIGYRTYKKKESV